MLIAFGGLPGTGKTTLAQSLARNLAAVYVRVDSLEQAMIRSGASEVSVGSAGYMAGYAIAADNLRIGLTVVADSVNSLNITRNAWRNVALEAAVEFVEIELICSDSVKHRLRVESRIADIPEHQLPNWQLVLERDYDFWSSAHLIVDTALLSADQAVEAILQHLIDTGFAIKPLKSAKPLPPRSASPAACLPLGETLACAL